MGKKRKQPSLDSLLERPWCYYCDRDFDDLAVLLDHQRAKHFKCHICPKRLHTAGGLMVHVQNVHKESIDTIANALPGREGTNLEIWGMLGVPEDYKKEKTDSVIAMYKKKEADHIALTGNPLAGTAEAEARERAAKKPKPTESKEAIQARVAAHREKMRAEKEAKAQAKAAGDSAANNSDGGVQQADTQPKQGGPQHSPPQYGGPQASTPFEYHNMHQQLPASVSPNPLAPHRNPLAAHTPMVHPNMPNLYPTPPFPQHPQGFPPGFPPGGAPPQPSQPGFFPDRLPHHPRHVAEDSQAHWSRRPSQGTPPVHGQFSAPDDARSNSLPKVPGLPERPSFGGIGVSTAAMKSLHPGHQPLQPWSGGQDGHHVTAPQDSNNNQVGAPLDEVDQAIADAIAGKRPSPSQAAAAGPPTQSQSQHQFTQYQYAPGHVASPEAREKARRFEEAFFFDPPLPGGYPPNANKDKMPAALANTTTLEAAAPPTQAPTTETTQAPAAESSKPGKDSRPVRLIYTGYFAPPEELHVRAFP
ncbi:uncharacterized protein LTR77_008719 [Saxophila tyrrhenica]|uniref:BED-type domain-containing protein n=1 Tax=Saxophila tyrrhenica TaxID=1690608 RepID=A0AAV9P2V4_9PEZI|nr:hypothetical protein LTR77_008719 [Saxophila tyrrhenica]